MNEIPSYITQHRGLIFDRYMQDMYQILSKVCYNLEPDEIMEGIIYSINKNLNDHRDRRSYNIYKE